MAHLLNPVKSYWPYLGWLLLIAVIVMGAKGQIINPGSGSGGGLPSGLSFSAPTLTVSTSGSGNGAVALSGNTSGTATFTAPATAGTTTNGVTMSNVLVGPDEAAQTSPTYGFTDSAQTGMGEGSAGGLAVNGSASVTLNAGTGAITFETAATTRWQITSGGNFTANAAGLHFTSSGTGNDREGHCAMTSGACTAISFTTAYTSTPNCQVTWLNSTGATGILFSNASTTGLQPKSSVSTDTGTAYWQCVGDAF